MSQGRTVVGMSELFDDDLSDDTMTRVTNGYEGGPSEHPHKKVLSGEAQYRNDRRRALAVLLRRRQHLAFSSTASNLVYGDGNTPPVTQEVPPDRQTAATSSSIARKVFPPQSTETYVSPAPPNPVPTPPWSLSVTSRLLSNGAVQLYVEVPGAGSLPPPPQSAVPVRAPRAAPAPARPRQEEAGPHEHRQGR